MAARQSPSRSNHREGVIAGGLEVTVMRAILLLTVHRNLGRVLIQHDPLLPIDGFYLADEFAVDIGQATEVLLPG